MALFDRGRKSAEVAQLREEWRGKLNDELWRLGSAHEAYFRQASDLSGEFAEYCLRQKVRDPLPRTARGTIAKMLPNVVPGHNMPLISDAATTAFLSCDAESWTELDSQRTDQLVTDGCAIAAREVPEATSARFRTGSALFGVLTYHPDHEEERRIDGFEPLYRYLTEQPSYQRLETLRAHYADLDQSAFLKSDLAPNERTAFRSSHSRAWHLGACVWMFTTTGLIQLR